MEPNLKHLDMILKQENCSRMKLQSYRHNFNFRSRDENMKAKQEMDPCFEIKIALIGHVSAGKTTVINALLRDKFGEVSMRRTTAGINYFRITARNSTKVTQSQEPVTNDTKSFGAHIYDADDTLKEITKDNVILRASSQVQEKTFDIEIDEDLFEMRKNTKIVLVDIPGINEANASSKYKDYVAEKWHTFDCVILVMDARQGVNTEEQISLLAFVKSNLRERKDLPLIILCNKVDDPDDEEQSVLVAEARAEVEKLFQVSSREASLQSILGRLDKGNSKRETTAGKANDDDYPVMLAVSARTAFVYQTASGMSQEKFNTFDEGLIEKIGREQVGKTKWKKFSRGEKYEAAYNVLMDPEHYKDGLADSNFDKFLCVLSNCVGGCTTQQRLLEKQIQVALAMIDKDKEIMIASQLQLLYHNRKALETKKLTKTSIKFESQVVTFYSDDPFSDASITQTFWKVYQKREDDAFREFDSYCEPLLLSNPLIQLIQYYGFCEGVNFSHEYVKITDKLVGLVQRYIKFILDKCMPCFRAEPFCSPTRYSSLQGRLWHLGVDEWLGVIYSILLPSYSGKFCEVFGHEKILLEEFKAIIRQVCPTGECPLCHGNHSSSQGYHSGSQNRPRCAKCNITFSSEKCDCTDRCGCDSCKNKGQFAPRHRGIRAKMVMFEHILEREGRDEFWSTQQILVIPKSLSDPNHFGHLCWKACKFLECVENTALPRPW